MKISPIKTEIDHQNALKEISLLMNSLPNTPDGDLLDVLVTLVEVYETQHHPINPPDPIEAIKFRLEQEHLSRKDLGSILQVRRGRVSEVLTKKRPLTLKMMRAIHSQLGVPAEVLLKEYTLHKSYHPHH